jgi:hypothetical protein
MRASEFMPIKINESADTKISPRLQAATRGLNIFSKKIDTYDRLYDLNRLMMAVASSDGVNTIEMPAESWAGKHNTAHPYTKEEQDMLKLAYEAAGLSHIDLNNGDLNSEEIKEVNKVSPVASFKGYPR